MVMKMMYALPRLKENLTEVSIDDQLTLGDPPLNFSAPLPTICLQNLAQSENCAMLT